MGTLSDGTVYQTGRTSDGTKLHKIISSPNKSYVGKYVDSANLNKWSTGGTPTFYGNSLGIASWQSTTPAPTPAPAPTPTPPTPTPSSGGGYGVQSTDGSTSTVGAGELGTLQSKVDQLKAQVAANSVASMGRQAYDALITQMGDAEYALNQFKQAHGIPLSGNQMGPVLPPGPVLTIEPGKGGMEGNISEPSQPNPAQMAARIFPNDVKAQQEFVNRWNEGLAYERLGQRTRADTERNALLAANHVMSNPFRWLDDFLTDNPVGQVLAPILENGIGVTTGVGPGSSTGTTVHTGMPAPTTTSPQPNWDTVIDNAVNNYTPPPTTINGGSQSPGTMTNNGPVLNNPTYGPNTGAPGLPPPTTPAPTTPTTPAPSDGSGAPGTTGTTTPTTGTTGTTTPATGLLNIPGLTPELAAIVASGGGSALATWLAAKTQADAATQAATTQSEAAERARQLQETQFNTIRDDWKPWREAGAAAIGELQNFNANNPEFGMAQFRADPGYSFRLSEGMKALQNSAAARGNLLSGNTLKGIENYGQEAASQEYQNAFNRYQTNRGNKLNQLQSLAGMNQTAIQQTNQAGQNYANQAGSAYANAANATANGQMGAANASASGWVGGASVLNNALGNYLNYSQGQKMINALGGY